MSVSSERGDNQGEGPCDVLNKRQEKGQMASVESCWRLLGNRQWSWRKLTN
jgi:hypothetical protein